MSKKYKATLVRGETYVLGNKTWLRGQSHPIDANTKRHLEQSAVDRLTTTGPDGKEVSLRQKFKFEVITELEETAAAKGKSDKLAELESMQNDGGVDFEDDEPADEEHDDVGDADSADDEAGDEPDEETAPAPEKAKRANPVRSRTGRRK